MTAALWRRAALLSSALLLSAGWYVAARTSVDRALERGEGNVGLAEQQPADDEVAGRE